MCHLCRHADGFPKCGMRVNRLANVHRFRAHLDGQGNLADHVAGVGADHTAAQNFAVAVSFRAVVTSVATCASCQMQHQIQ